MTIPRPEILRLAREARVTELETLLGEAYVVVAALAERCRHLDHPGVVKALEKFSEVELGHEILPFEVPDTLGDLLREAMPHLPGEMQRRVRATLGS